MTPSSDGTHTTSAITNKNSPLVEFKNATKRYGKNLAVSDLNLSLAPGELFGFLGPNGAGKTTAMKMAVGLIRMTEGNVIIAGHDIQKEPILAKRLVGFVPDSPYIYDSLTGREFLYYCAGLYKMNHDETSSQVESLFEKFKIGKWADNRAGEYSHGMKQRVVMASAFLHSPRVIMIDEPMVGLDPGGVKLVKGVLQEFTAGGGTVFLSTHTLSVAEEVCERIGIIKSGKLIALGSQDDIVEKDVRLEDFFLALTSEPL